MENKVLDGKTTTTADDDDEDGYHLSIASSHFVAYSFEVILQH